MRHYNVASKGICHDIMRLPGSVVSPGDHLVLVNFRNVLSREGLTYILQDHRLPSAL